MQAHNLKRKTANRSVAIVGRGGRRGKTSGRGGKGQTARAGHKVRPEIRDLIKRIPKLRGYAFKGFGVRPIAINVGDLSSVFSSGDAVNPKSIVRAGLAELGAGKNPTIKILAGGEIDKKLIISNCKVSVDAKAKIEKAGGQVK
ncbi:MAG: uL15 family ribosomal protein [Candidatus Paceibacterota bacterium]|jgi:large subunit ribosomal protein L15